VTRGPTVEALRLSRRTVARGGRPVVQDVSLEIPRGDVTALLGPNGAGKSTLVLAVAGVLKPLSGSIDLGGRELRGRRPEIIRHAGVAVVPEGRRLLSELSVEDNVQVATYSLSREEAKAGRAYALDLFPELTKRRDVPAPSLSGGEQQMLVLAQALVSQPSYILIDELSLGLASVVVKRLIHTIRTVAESRGRRAAHRAVRDRRARAGTTGPRHEPRADPVLGRRERAQGAPRAAADLIPAGRRRLERGRPRDRLTGAARPSRGARLH
jgi:branched-chain amino acid transport system ATP-binding protein